VITCGRDIFGASCVVRCLFGEAKRIFIGHPFFDDGRFVPSFLPHPLVGFDQYCQMVHSLRPTSLHLLPFSP